MRRHQNVTRVTHFLLRGAQRIRARHTPRPGRRRIRGRRTRQHVQPPPQLFQFRLLSCHARSQRVNKCHRIVLRITLLVAMMPAHLITMRGTAADRLAVDAAADAGRGAAATPVAVAVAAVRSPVVVVLLLRRV